VIQTPKLGCRIMRYELADCEWDAIKPMLPRRRTGATNGNSRSLLAVAGRSEVELKTLSLERCTAQYILYQDDFCGRFNYRWVGLDEQT
jgi:hypothetical protein